MVSPYPSSCTLLYCSDYDKGKNDLILSEWASLSQNTIMGRGFGDRNRYMYIVHYGCLLDVLCFSCFYMNPRKNSVYLGRS